MTMQRLALAALPFVAALVGCTSDGSCFVECERDDGVGGFAFSNQCTVVADEAACDDAAAAHCEDVDLPLTLAKFDRDCPCDDDTCAP